jgi:hypothetical protein
MKHPGHTYGGFIPAISKRGMTGTDISDLPGLFTQLSVDFSWVPHRAFTSCFFSTHALYSLMFGVLGGNGSW